jgi:multisubunit Na+/H+ antiporter MnhE subunit
MSSVALNAGQVPNIGTGLLVGIVVVGLLLAIFITSLVARIVIVVVVIALGAYVWQQRTVIQNRISKDKCQLNTTFFGIHVKAPTDVVKACQQQLSR